MILLAAVVALPVGACMILFGRTQAHLVLGVLFMIVAMFVLLILGVVATVAELT